MEKKQLDPDPQTMNVDPQPGLIKSAVLRH